MAFNQTAFWLFAGAALLYAALRLLGVEGAVLVGLLWLLLHLLRPSREKAEETETGLKITSSEAEQEPVEFEFGTELDLHAFAPSEVGQLVRDYLEHALENGYQEVRIVHGKGKGVQKRIVRSLLDRHPGVSGYRDAPMERGSWGATLVHFKQNEKSR